MSDTQSRLRWRPAYIGIGSNLESPEGQISRAVAAIDQLPGCRLEQRSSNYLSAPLGRDDQPDYVNAVVAILTTLEAHDLLGQCQAIERDQGRVRDHERWGPRTLDLDLLVFSGDRIDEPGPHCSAPAHWRTKFCIVATGGACARLADSGPGHGRNGAGKKR